MQSLSNEALTLIADRFRVLAEPARLRILNTLMAGECTVSELAEQTKLRQANLSKHLGLLRASGFVTRRREGLYAWYTVADPSVADLCQIMCGRLEAQAERRVEMLTADASAPDGSDTGAPAADDVVAGPRSEGVRVA